MKKYYLILIILSIACSDREKVLEFYDDGTVFKSYYIRNGEFNGEYLEYYKNGNIKIQGNFESNVANGTFKEFSIDGKLIKKGNYVDNKAIGWFEYYENGSLRMKRHYILKDNQSILNQYIIYDKSKNIVKDSSNYVSIAKTNIDNRYVLRLEASMFKSDYMEVLVGYFDDNFRPLNQTLIDTIKVKGNPEVVVEILDKEKIIVCDILEFDSIRQNRFIYVDPLADFSDI